MMWVSFITKGNKQNGKKVSQVTKGMEMNWGEKRTTQRIHLIDVNGGLNNKQIALRKVVSKKK